MHPLTLTALILTLAAALACQDKPPEQSPEAALIMVENVWGEDGLCNAHRLVRFRIGDGVIAAKQVIIEKEQRFFGHFGRHKIVDNRFVVTHDGATIDLGTGEEVETPKVMTKAKAKPKHRLKRPNRSTELFAPSGKDSARIADDGSLWLRTATGKSRRLAKGFGYTLSFLSSGSAHGAPLVWLDDNRLLTQRANGSLLVVDRKGEVEVFVNVEGIEDPVSAPSLHFDLAGRLIYCCGEDFVIDIKKREAIPSPFRALGHGFFAERDLPIGRGRAVRYRGKEIGRFVCIPYLAKSAPGRVAIPCAKRSHLGYPNAIRFWDAKSRKWSVAKTSINTLIGWTR